MKKIFTLLSLVLITLTLSAQAPQKLSYQFVVRNASGALVSSAPVGVRVAILQGSPTGIVVYHELFNPNPVTNANGLVSIEIGTGLPITGTFSSINWAGGPYYLKTETDPTGGTSYTVVGTSQLISVPYALYSGAAESIPNNSVTSAKIVDGTITAADLGTGSVTSAKIADGTIVTTDLADANVTSVKIADGTIASADVANSSITSAKIADGTITDADVNATANINISKILGAAGIEFNYPSDYKVWNAGQIQMQTMATITMDVPSSGYVLLIHSGYITFSSFQRVMEVGVGTNSTGMINNAGRVGTLDGTSTNRYIESYSVSHVASVTAGPRTFYALACGESSFSTGVTVVTTTAFVGVFIPKKY